ncbi:MAG: Uma2 family endonuclease [Calditrichaceae bacterium]|nr:Uma2 family endonuclease [Calditrichia bacterium]NUQ42529.1 Uma2 family endonuclease [Calditrichaceae bacterium]
MAVVEKKAAKKRAAAKSSGRKGKFRNETHPAGEYLYFVEGTLEDFYNLEEQKAEFLEEGILVMHSPASVTHERVFRQIFRSLCDFVEEKGLGEVLGSQLTIVLGKRRFAPDIVFISKNNPGKFGEVEFIGAPELVVEIVSKTTRPYDLKIKREIYREYKIREIYFIDYLNKTLIVDVLQGDGYVTHTLKEGQFASVLLKGFAVKCFGASNSST